MGRYCRESDETVTSTHGSAELGLVASQRNSLCQHSRKCAATSQFKGTRTLCSRSLWCSPMLSSLGRPLTRSARRLAAAQALSLRSRLPHGKARGAVRAYSSAEGPSPFGIEIFMPDQEPSAEPLTEAEIERQGALWYSLLAEDALNSRWADVARLAPSPLFCLEFPSFSPWAYRALIFYRYQLHAARRNCS